MNDFVTKIKTQSIEANAANLIATCEHYYKKNQGRRGRARESMRIYNRLYDQVLEHLPPNSEQEFRSALWDVIVETRPEWFPLGGIPQRKKPPRPTAKAATRRSKLH